MKANENKSYTRPMGNDDVRKNHSDNVNYGSYERNHPHRNTGPGGGWKQQGQEPSFAKTEKRPPMPKQDRNPGKHPHQGK